MFREKGKKFESLGKIFSAIHWQSRIYMERKLKPYNLGWGEFHVLRKLYDNKEMRQNEITDCLKVTKSTTSKVMKKLEGEGYIVRRKDRMDNRTYVIRVTRKAMKLKTSLEKISREWNNILLEGFGDDDIPVIINALEKMAENAEKANSRKD